MWPCGFPGHTRTSRLGTQYFAHNPGGDGCSAGEATHHLLAKSIIPGPQELKSVMSPPTHSEHGGDYRAGIHRVADSSVVRFGVFTFAFCRRQDLAYFRWRLSSEVTRIADAPMWAVGRGAWPGK